MEAGLRPGGPSRCGRSGAYDMPTNPAKKKTWSEAIAQLRSADPGLVGQIDVAAIEHPVAAGMIRTEPTPAGQRADFRLVLEDGMICHVREIDEHYFVQLVAGAMAPRPEVANPTSHSAGAKPPPRPATANSTSDSARVKPPLLAEIADSAGHSVWGRPSPYPDLVDAVKDAAPVQRTWLQALDDLSRDVPAVTIASLALAGAAAAYAAGGKRDALRGAVYGGILRLAAVAVSNADSSPAKTKAATDLFHIGTMAVSGQPVRSARSTSSAKGRIGASTTKDSTAKKKSTGGKTKKKPSQGRESEV